MAGKLESHMQKMKLDCWHRTWKLTQNGFKTWVWDLKLIKCKEENIGTKFMDLGLRGIFVNLTLKAREVKAKINERDCIKQKSFCMAKDIIFKC